MSGQIERGFFFKELTCKRRVMPRRRSPCSPSSKKLPKYKRLARDLPDGAVETLERYRYRPQSPGKPCRVVTDDRAPGRTNCYAPSNHSKRRKTCQLLVHPDKEVPDVEPGLYLYGSPRFREHLNFTCQIMDDMYQKQTIGQGDRPLYSILVLGPYVEPRTGHLVVRCLDVQMFKPQDIRDTQNLGTLFMHLEEDDTFPVPEKIIPVPTAKMLKDVANRDFVWASRDPDAREFKDDVSQRPFDWDGLAVKFLERATELKTHWVQRERFSEYCEQHPDFKRKMRKMAKMCWDFSLYGRQWAGPSRKMPFDKLAGRVGSPSNPLDPKIRGRFVQSSANGPRLFDDPRKGMPADFTQDTSLLLQMCFANAESIIKLYATLADGEKVIARSAWIMGLPFWMIDDSGYWTSREEVNFTNGNGAHFPLNVFSQLGGTRNTDYGLFAHQSVIGTPERGGYCVQIASSHLGRMVLTMLPYLYANPPTWSRSGGELQQWPNLHT